MKRKLAMLLVLVMVTVIAAGCEVGSIKDSGSDYKLSEEQQEMLGISQEEFDNLPEEARAELQEMLEDMAAELESANNQSQPTDAPEPINPEEDVQKYLTEMPPLPEGERKYDYEWSNRLDRITYYIITIDSVPEEAVYDYLYLLETEYGYVSEGKEIWDESRQVMVYEYSTESGILYVEVSPPDENGNVTVSFWISYDPYK